MLATLTLPKYEKIRWPKFDRFSRAVKLTAVAIAIFYLINGTGAAVGYMTGPKSGTASPTQQIAEAIWQGAKWPWGAHKILYSDRLQRLTPLTATTP